jgi:hypothetical protein
MDLKEFAELELQSLFEASGHGLNDHGGSRLECGDSALGVDTHKFPKAGSRERGLDRNHGAHYTSRKRRSGIAGRKKPPEKK